MIHGLPVVERELLLRARASSTGWVRMGAAAIALLVASTTLSWRGPAMSNPQLGRLFFDALLWVLLALAAVMGPWLAADTLNRERRDGTLGLLLLTPLSSLDVVLGKMVAVSLHLALALLASTPMLALALVLGGVTMDEVFLGLVAVLNLLFASLACGTLASAKFDRDWQAANRAYVWMGLWVGLPGLLLPLGLPSIFLLSSPWGAFAYGTGAVIDIGRYLTSLLAVHGIGWLLLLQAARITRRQVGEQVSQVGPPRRQRQRSRPQGRAWVSSVAGQDPGRWLASRDGSLRWVFWGAVLLPLLANPLMGLVVQFMGGAFSMGSSYAISLAVSVLPLFLIARAAAGRVAGVRDTGVLELVLTSSLPSTAVAAGYARAVLSALTVPLAVLLVIRLAVLGLQSTGWGAGGGMPKVFFALNALGLVQLALNLVAAVWLGLWLGLTLRSPNTAAFWTVGVLGVVPWLLLAVTNIVVGVWASGTGFGVRANWFWLPYIGRTVVMVGFVSLVLVWARRRFLDLFRAAAAGLASWSTWPHSPPP